MRLSATTKSIEILLGGAVTTNELQFTGDYDDLTQSGTHISALQDVQGETDGTTPVDVFGSPDAGITRQIKSLSIYNADTVNADVIVRLNDGSDTYIIIAQTLKEGISLNYNFGSGWSINEVASSTPITLGTMALQDADDVDITGGTAEFDTLTMLGNVLSNLPMASGFGLDFAADGGNVFNQFKIGSFTPSFTALTTPFSSITYGTDTGGAYVKFPGFYVFVCRIQVATVSGGSGSIVVSGMPFTAVNSSTGTGGGLVTYKASWVTTGPTGVFAGSNTTTLSLTSNNNTGVNFLDAANLGAGTDVLLAGVVFTAT